jgi:hypothetical protein
MFVESIGSDHLLSPVLRERAEQLSKEKRQFANEPIAVVAGNVLKAAYAESLPQATNAEVSRRDISENEPSKVPKKICLSVFECFIDLSV